MAKPKVQPTQNMIALAKELHDYRTQIDGLEATAKELEEKASELEKELVPLIIATYEEIGDDGEPKEVKGRSFDIDDKYKAIMSTRAHPSINSGQEAEVHKWLREKGYPSAVREYVFPQTFKKIITDMAEEQERDVKDIVNTELASSVTVFIEKKISFRKK